MKSICLVICMIFFALTGGRAQQTVTTPGGSTNSIPKFSGSSSIANSAITENNGQVGIGTTTPQATLHVSGNNVPGMILEAQDALHFGTVVCCGAGPTGSSLGSTAGWSSFFNGVFLNSNGTASGGFTGAQNNTSLPSWRMALGSGSLEWPGADNFAIGRVPPGGNYLTPSILFTVSNSGFVKVAGGIIFPNGSVQTTAAGTNGGGTITGVAAGAGLTGGGTSGAVTLSVDSTVARTNVNQTFNGNLTVNGTITATHVNSADFTTVISGSCITESFSTPYVLNGLGQTKTSDCTFGPGTPINPGLGTVIPYTGTLGALQVVQTSLSSGDAFGGQVQVYTEPFNQSGGWTLKGIGCTLTASSSNPLNSITSCSDLSHTLAVQAGEKILVLVTPPPTGFGSYAPVSAILSITY